MEPDDLESESESIARAVEIVDKLLFTADGGREAWIGEYEASTILALLMDKTYRVQVMSRLDHLAEVEVGG